VNVELRALRWAIIAAQVEALPPIEVNVCFRVLIPESGLANFGQTLP
jgi:hypothetical protein